MHSAYVITNKGAEDICAKEIKDSIKCSNIEKEDTVVKFSFPDLLELCRFTYRAQSIYRAVLLLGEFSVEKDIKKTLENAKTSLKNISDWIGKNKKFQVECQREGEHDFKSVDVAAAMTKYLIEKEKTMKTEYDNPELSFYIYIYQGKGYFGVDFSGFELAKRQYKIFNHPESLKGTTAFAVVKEAELNENTVMLDPFMGSGVIVIEAGLYLLNYPVHYYDKDKLMFTKYDFFKEYGYEKFYKEEDKKIKNIDTEVYGYDGLLRFLKAAQKNAKLAGIDKYIKLSKVDAEWLDIKFKEDTVDMIISDPPRVSKRKDDKELLKLYKELFYQAEYILKDGGKVVLLAKGKVLLEEAAKKHKFKIKKEYTVYQGQEKFNVLLFERE